MRFSGRLRLQERAQPARETGQLLENPCLTVMVTEYGGRMRASLLDYGFGGCHWARLLVVIESEGKIEGRLRS